MAVKLGRLFLNAAMGPVAYAGRCIMARKVHTGIQELSSESLMGSLQRGVDTVAKEVGVPSTYVSGLLPVDELHTLIDRIHKNQAITLQQWDMHTGHIGGLMDGIADLTVDRRPPDASLCLLRLSRKMKMDKQLAMPLRDLSEDLDKWQELLHRCRSIIDDGRSLKEAYRKRRLLFGSVIALALLLALVVIGIGSVYWLARKRLDAVLASADACAAEQADADDVSKASGTQREQLKFKRAQCDSERRAAEKRAEEERKQKEHQAELARKLAEREKKCKQLISALETRTITSASLEVEPDRNALIKRLVAQRLSIEDVSRDLVLPCSNTSSADGVQKAYARGVLQARPYWLGKHTLSSKALQAMVTHKDALPEGDVQILAWASEDRAKKAVKGGKMEIIQRAAQLCELATKLDLPPRNDCTTAIAMARAPSP